MGSFSSQAWEAQIPRNSSGMLIPSPPKCKKILAIGGGGGGGGGVGFRGAGLGTNAPATQDTTDGDIHIRLAEQTFKSPKSPRS